jgi:hypothetical protein
MTRNNRHFSILSLNVNGLNAPFKRQRIANWIKKTRPNHMLLTRDSSNWKKINSGSESKGGKKFSKQIDPINKQE